MIKNYAIDDSSVNFIFHNGKMKIAQYGYYDSCPMFMGVDILIFLRKILPINSNEYMSFIKNLDKCQFSNQIGNYDDENGAMIFDKIYEYNKPARIYLSNHYKELDSLIFLVEWGYIVDLDNKTFEIYEGNNVKPVKKGERFYNLN